jgi:hypothetical protein
MQPAMPRTPMLNLTSLERFMGTSATQSVWSKSFSANGLFNSPVSERVLCGLGLGHVDPAVFIDLQPITRAQPGEICWGEGDDWDRPGIHFIGHNGG